MYVGEDAIMILSVMVWIANLLLTIIASIWGLWVCGWGRAEWDSLFIKWFLICWNVKEKSGKVAWNEFLAIMKYLTLHYIQRPEADLLYEYESFVNMTPLYPNNHGRYSDEELEQLAYQLYGVQNEPSINHDNSEVAFHAASGGERLTETETKNNEQLTQDGVKCVYCGEIIEKDSSFCPYCGKSQLQEKKVEEPQADAKQEQMPSEQPVSDQPSKEKPTSILQEEETVAELKEKKKPKTWPWIVLAVLLAGVGAWYFLQSQDQEILPEREVEAEIAVLPDSIYTEEEYVAEEEVTGYHSFLEQFYKNYEDETYLLSHITVNVKNKLKRDYGYDCPSGECLATWEFTAQPTGADLGLEEGPIITATDEEGKFQVDFKYSGYNGEKKEYQTMTVFLTVTEIDGKYLISDYELKADAEQGQDETLDDDLYQDAGELENRSSENGQQEDKIKQTYEILPNPVFPGGDRSLGEYLNRNLRYPVVAEENGVQGTVTVQFVVGKDGIVSNARVVKSVDPSLDREALRLVNNMPRWTPASNQDGPFASQQTITINFKIK